MVQQSDARAAFERVVLRAALAGLALGGGLRAARAAEPLDAQAAASLPEVTVVAMKAPAPARELPLSVTAVGRDFLDAAGAHTVKDAAAYAPNVHVVEFTTRQLSNPYVRGIGASPGNPAITTYLDGVPQLHGYSANVELVDVEQVEFVRGPQGALYGRNTLGGVIHVTSRLPSDHWEGAIEAGGGNYDAHETRFRLSGPVVPDRLRLSLAGGYAARDGFTENDVTGDPVDDREALFGKLQLHLTPPGPWSARFILAGERDRDGDYALGDLEALRDRPHHVQRDVEGHSHRDLLAPSLWVERRGEAVDFTSISGLVAWESRELTDLDYSPMPAVTRNARVESLQFTQEFRLGSSPDAPVELAEDWRLRWQAGLSGFTRAHREKGTNAYAAYVLAPTVDFPVSQTSPRARLDDWGVGAYGQATLTAWERLELGLGVRGDYERKEADLRTFYTPAIAPATALETDSDYAQVSPQFSLAWHVTPSHTVYAAASRGYRAGGFNPISPTGSESYDEETSWSYEVGCKTAWWDERLTVSLAAFYISWRDLQLNLPVGQSYYVANAGDADSKGAELEIRLRPLPGWDLFGGVGCTEARFLSDATSIRTDASGVNTAVNVGGNRLGYAPEFTANAGTQVTWEFRPGLAVFARAEVVACGRYFYNPANTASQDAYALANFRAGLHGKGWMLEAWVKNAFDKEYVPVAFEFPNYQSGFLAESGAPLTFGLRAGVSF
ncbi:MAG: Pesticin receptor precursor [Lentisphaerae bacterium ADurb.BinA184]|nr:MAG: Pesticin receptor precursor [Lentisphaerae bacterium ADurb.BinA184]